VLASGRETATQQESADAECLCWHPHCDSRTMARRPSRTGARVPDGNKGGLSLAAKYAETVGLGGGGWVHRRCAHTPPLSENG